jgi:amino acid adenylation domain-containing protein
VDIDEEEYFSFSLSQKDTLIHKSVAETPLRGNPVVLQTQRKGPLERLPVSETTSPLMQVIRGVHVKRLSEYFEQTCDRRPHKTAVICGSSQLTYQELDHRANRLAHFLISRGLGKGHAIGILLERSLDTYIALLGVLKAGAVFVPLDPSFPSVQMTFITKDAGLLCLVTTSAFREKTSDLSCPVLELDQAYEALSVQHETRPEVRVDPSFLCYIIYTRDANSQSKRVAVSHASIVNFLRVVTPIYRLMRNDRVYQGMSIALDFSFGEIWPAWIAGATLVVGPPASQHPGHVLTKFLIEHNITVLCCLPTLLDTIESDIPSLRILLVAGDACPAYLLSRWLRKGRRMLKTYGPIETIVNVTWCELFLGHSVTIGSPFLTYQIYILDDQFRLVQDGESGEICIGGPGVATSSLNPSGNTNDRFVPNPVLRDRRITPCLYRTGDSGRITPSGEIEYLGLIDVQMKTRSYHIEYDSIARVALSQVNTAPLIVPPRTDMVSLKGYAATPPFGSKAISELEAETSKLSILNQKNFKSIYSHIMSDPLYRNSLFIMASAVVLGGLGFVFWIIIARLYKTEDVGIATTLISVMSLLSSLTLMGLHSSIPRYLPKSADKNELINSSFVIVTLATLLVSVIFLLGLQIFSPRLLFLRSNVFYVISFTIFIIFCSWNILVDAIFIAFRSAGNILIKSIIISVLKLGLPFALIAFGAYGIFASTASAFALGVLAGLVILLLKFKIRPSVVVNISLIKEISAYSFANYIVDSILNIPSLVLPVIILNVLSANYAAYYYIVSMFQSMLLIIPLATAQALLTEGSYNEAELKKHVKKAAATILLMLIPATAVMVFAGNILLQFFGKNYATEAFQFLQLISVSTFFTALLLIANAILNIKHKIKTLVMLNVMESTLTLGLSYAFISGKLVGLGWGWLLGQVIAGLVSLYFIIRNYSDAPQSRVSPGKVQRVFE